MDERTTMRLTVLADDRVAGEGLLAENGLALRLEHAPARSRADPRKVADLPVNLGGGDPCRVADRLDR